MQKKRNKAANIFYFPDDRPRDEGKHKCIFCSEGMGIRNIIDQIEKMAQVSGIPKHDIIQLTLIEEIRKIRIALEGKSKPLTIPDSDDGGR